MPTFDTRLAQARAALTADKYIQTVRTPDQLVARTPERRPERTPEPAPPPLPAHADSHKDLQKWSREKKLAFEMLRVHGVYIAASKQAMSVVVYDDDGTQKRFGHNRGMRLLKVGTTASWRDTVTTLVDRIPFVRMSADTRLWCVNAETAHRFAEAITDMVARKAEEYGYETDLLHGFQDVGPTLDWQLFLEGCAFIAKQHHAAHWNDRELSNLLNYILTEGMRRGVTPYDGQAFMRLADEIMAQDIREQFPNVSYDHNMRGHWGA